MSIHGSDILGQRLGTLVHSPEKMTFLYFLLFFSVFAVLLSPFYLRNGGTRVVRSLVVSLLLGIIVSLVYMIYVTGGFNA
ncbi:MAG: hypothetical protein M1491_03195 [Deltaproteobacteria bacterium]|nr:hypothetical protein [Deltaproteobacteria bacterium]MCL5277382.1 hypothetical protein [Deltaproteobacteria bacterium]MCL5277384.1 hypothetical protein [Deltaproteobacteria bacterium]